MKKLQFQQRAIQIHACPIFFNLHKWCTQKNRRANKSFRCKKLVQDKSQTFSCLSEVLTHCLIPFPELLILNTKLTWEFAKKLKCFVYCFLISAEKSKSLAGTLNFNSPLCNLCHENQLLNFFIRTFIELFEVWLT